MISIVSICHDRQYCLDAVLPSWLAQEGIEFEVVIAAGPGIKRIDHPKVRYIDFPVVDNGWFHGGGAAYNAAYREAKGELIYSCYSDMVLQDKSYIAKMRKHYKHGRIVNRQALIKNGFFNDGIWCYGFLTSKELIAKSGGFDESYGEGYAFEDADMMHGLIAAGGELVILKPLPENLELRHIDHPRATPSAELTRQYALHKRKYNKKYPTITLMDMYRKGMFKVYEDTDND